MDEAQLQSFRQLKPVCIAVGQSYLSYKQSRTQVESLSKSLEVLLSTLQVCSGAIFLDPKLADYVFFPLSHIFRDGIRAPKRAIEISVECLHILIVRGWAAQIKPEMSKQLIILLSFIAGGGSMKSDVESVSEELAIVSFDCLAALFACTQNAGLDDKGSISTDGLPLLGHMTTIILDGIKLGPSVQVRSAAVSACDAMSTSMTDLEALRNMLPGIASSLTRALAMRGHKQPNTKFLTEVLGTFRRILTKVLADGAVANPKLTAWATATGAQIHMALVTICQLKDDTREQIKDALLDLTTSILITCTHSLSQSQPLLLEVSLTLCASRDNTLLDFSRLSEMLVTEKSLVDCLQTIMHSWLTSLPRIMNSPLGDNKIIFGRQISLGLRLLHGTNVSLEVLASLLLNSLSRIVEANAEGAAKKRITGVINHSKDLDLILKPSDKSQIATFPFILFDAAGEKTLAMAVGDLIELLCLKSNLQASYRGICASLYDSTGKHQMAAFWLALQLIKKGAPTDTNEQLMNLTMGPDSLSSFRENVYDFALNFLTSSSSGMSLKVWQMEAMALEAIACQARALRQDFRPELVEALYPMLCLIGSSMESVQAAAIACLNDVSSSCCYKSARDLIVDNADYLINAVSLKLSVFDISPQAPQVLVMMIKLGGPTLLPYLDDVMEAMFTILAAYHGYAVLVEAIFAVLSQIVFEATKSEVALIKDSRDTITRPKICVPITMSEVKEELRLRRERRAAHLPNLAHDGSVHHPARPFTDLIDEAEESCKAESTEPTTSDREVSPAADPLAAKPSKTYMLIADITRLSPSYLTSPSAAIRTSVLSLLTSSLPLLAKDTDLFLPVAAQLYSYITARLFAITVAESSTIRPSSVGTIIIASGHPGSSSASRSLEISDTTPSPSEVAAAARALRTLCVTAGDFLATRIEDDWLRILRTYEIVERKMLSEIYMFNPPPERRLNNSSAGSPYLSTEKQSTEDTSRRLKTSGSPWWVCWNALVALLVDIIQQVGINPMGAAPEPRNGEQSSNGRKTMVESLPAEDELFNQLGVYVGLECSASRIERILNLTIRSRRAPNPGNKTGRLGGRQADFGMLHDESGLLLFDEERRFVISQYISLIMPEDGKSNVRQALQGLNAGTYWLQEERGRVQMGGKPLERPKAFEGMKFVDIYS